MTALELIETLQRVPPGTVIAVMDSSDGWGEPSTYIATEYHEQGGMFILGAK